MISSIKITSLTNIGNAINYTTLLPVVNMAGTPTTQKANLQILGNAILSGAGGSYFAAAAQAINAQTVSNAAQPAITSLGNLTGLNVAGVSNLGPVANVTITGGTAGYLLSTNGSGTLSWASPNSVFNTGNVTFNDINIIGTGNLKLQPDSGDASAFLDIYLTGGPDIHIAGNGETVILGTDDAANVTIGTDGNVRIQANTGTPQTWEFGNDGTTTFPTANVDLHNGGVQSGQVLQFGNPSLQAIITGPTPAANVSAERLIIQGQRGNGTGEGGDVYVWAGDADTNGGDIKIYAGDADNVSTGEGGYVNIDGGDGFNNGGLVEITGGYGAGGAGGAVSIVGGGSANGLTEHGNVYITAGNSIWSFNNDGTLTAPSTVTTNRFIQSPYQPVAPRGLVNQGTGILSEIATAISTGTGAISVTVDPTGRFVYSTNVSESSVSQYSINQSTGALTQITAPIASGSFPYDVAVDPTGRFVYVVSSGTGTVSQYSINQSTGELTEITTAIAAGTQSISIAVDPTGRFVYVTNYDSNTISQYSINQSTGELTEITTAIAAGLAPRDVSVDPTGRFVYSVSSTDYTVNQYSINQSTGALTAVTTISTGVSPFGIVVDPTGRFVYVANFGGDEVSQYSINQSTGVLSAITTEIGSGVGPFGIAVDPTGKFVYVTNQDDDTVSQYSINQVTGELTQITVAIPSIGMPSDVAVDPIGRFVYVTNYNDSTISQFGINNFSAGSATIPIINTGIITATSFVGTGVFVTGNIPAATTAGAGARVFVTDANANTFGTLYVGGAANAVPVWSDGSNWYIG